MRKVILSLAAAGAALVAATPAAAQYFPAPQGYGYGYNHSYGQVRALQARIDAVQWQIRRLDRYNVLRDDRADRLREESNVIENRLHRAARYGLNRYDAEDIPARISRLERRVQYASANRYGRYGQRDARYDNRDGRWDRDGDRDQGGYYGRDHDRDDDRD